jgi:hypothetical protein
MQQPRKGARRHQASAAALRALADKLAGQAKSAGVLVVVRLMRLFAAMPLALRESSRIKPNQGESSRIKPNQTYRAWGDYDYDYDYD